MMTHLTDPQAAVLAPALARHDRCIFPITAPLKGGAVGNVAKSLLKRGLLEEVPASDHAVVWRCSDEGMPLTLRLSDRGVAVAGGGGINACQHDESCVEPTLIALHVPAGKRGAAQEALLTLLRRAEGATIVDLQKVTGWQPHSVRGALSGVVAKKLGLPVVSTKEERGRVYRIAS